MATFTSSPNVDDHFVGTDAAADIFLFHVGHLNARDRIVGGNGPAQDRLVFSDAGQIYAQLLAGVTGIERIELANGTNRLYLTDQLVGTAQNRSVTVIGNNGDDVVNGWFLSAANRVDIHAGLGNDALIGGAGDDIFRFTASGFNQYDSVSGRGGYDRLVFTTAGPIYSEFLAGVTGIEQIELANGTNRLYLTDQLVGTAQNRSVTVIGNDGDDVVNGWFLSAANRVDIHAGLGNDALIGGAGDDIFRFTASGLNQYDSVSGRGGYDRLIFTTAGQIYSEFLAGVTGIEQIELANGSNRLYLTDPLVSTAQNRSITVIGNDGDDVVNGWFLSAANRVDIHAGLGNDALIGGAGDDIFRFTASGFNQYDSVSGRGGYDRLVFTTAGTINLTNWSSIYSVEEISFANGTNDILLAGNPDPWWYGQFKLTLNDGSDSLDASEFGMAVRVEAGAGDDQLIGSDADDSFLFRMEDFNAADLVYGGTSNWELNTLQFTTAGHLTEAQWNEGNKVQYIRLADGDNVVELTARMAANVYDAITIFDGEGNDSITVDSGRVIAHIGGGNDKVTGGWDSDQFLFDADTLDGLDRIDGRGGTDVITFLRSVNLTSADLAGVSSIESIEFLAANNRISVTDGFMETIDDGELLLEFLYGGEVDAAGLTADHSISVDSYYGAALLVGGAGADRFNFVEQGETYEPRSFIGGDVVVGGDGPSVDTLVLNYGTYYDAALLSGVSGIERMELHAYYFYDIYFDWYYYWETLIEEPHYHVEVTDALVASAYNHQLEIVADWGDDVIDASSLSAGNSVNVDGGGGNDQLLGGAGDDILTGGSGADIFAWIVPDSGTDSITDFTQGQDRLQFALDGFDINGAAFDRLVAQGGSGLTDINDADLLLFAGIVTDAADLRAQLTATTTGADVGEGLFVAARTSDGNTHIFYTGDASGTTDESIYDMADLGAVIAPSAITLGDFAFV